MREDKRIIDYHRQYGAAPKTKMLINRALQHLNPMIGPVTVAQILKHEPRLARSSVHRVIKEMIEEMGLQTGRVAGAEQYKTYCLGSMAELVHGKPLEGHHLRRAISAERILQYLLMDWLEKHPE